jgi:hypothetical protein
MPSPRTGPDETGASPVQAGEEADFALTGDGYSMPP